MKTIPNRSAAFTLIELLVVIAIISILTAMTFPALGRAKDAAKRIDCVSHVKQLALAFHLYADENKGYFPPRVQTNRWPTTLQRYYVDLKLLRCPTDTARQQPIQSSTTNRIAEVAPRSYLINGFNDFYRNIIGRQAMAQFRQRGDGELVIREQDVPEPSGTVAFGERSSDSQHFHMDFDALDDLRQLEQSRHGNTVRTGRGGGSNYGMVDGSVQFLRFGRSFNPINMWAVMPAERNMALAQ
jgi:prepilin-type N-terminal cleavage/methylation domain-containing protein/prepilin-type processing-associated H-X9-DG protein